MLNLVKQLINDTKIYKYTHEFITVTNTLRNRFKYYLIFVYFVHSREKLFQSTANIQRLCHVKKLSLDYKLINSIPEMSKHLSIVLITIFCVLYQSEAGSKEVKNKFRDEEIAPDVVEDLPELNNLKVSYPADINVRLGNILTPTQVKEEPKVEWDAEEGAFYTLLMTGKVH